MKKLIACTSITAVLLFSPVSADEDPGQELFLKYCKACHGTDGKAQTPMGKRLNIRDYTKAEVQADFTDEEMFKAIKEGVVNESGRKVMLPFEKKMSDDEISAVIAYVRSIAE